MKTSPLIKGDPDQETAGRTFTRSYYQVHSRVKQDDGSWSDWGGVARHGSMVAAKAEIQKNLNPILIAGFSISTNGRRKDLAQYRIVKYDCQCEVVHIEEAMI